MEIHERIKRFRNTKGFSQTDMAEKLGIALNNYSKIERGITELTIKRLEQLGGLLGVSLADLLGIASPPNQTERVVELEKRTKEIETLVLLQGEKITLLEENQKGNEQILRDFFFTVCMELGIGIRYNFNKKQLEFNDNEVKAIFEKLTNYAENTENKLHQSVLFLGLNNNFVDERFKELNSRHKSERMIISNAIEIIKPKTQE